MLGISSDDYLRENKKTRPGGGRTSPKTRLPTQDKTTKHNCSQCPNKFATQYNISEKETRWLCGSCKAKGLRKNDKEKPNFLKASMMHRE